MTADVQAPLCLDDRPDLGAVQDELDRLRAELRRHTDRLVLGETDPAARRLASEAVGYLAGQIAQLVDTGKVPAPRIVPAAEVVEQAGGPVVRTYLPADAAVQQQAIVLGALEVDRKWRQHVRCGHKRMAAGTWMPVHLAIHGPDHDCECVS